MSNINLYRDGGIEKTEEIRLAFNNKRRAVLFDVAGVLFGCPKWKVIVNFKQVIQSKFGEELSEEEVERLVFSDDDAQKLRESMSVEDYTSKLNIKLQAMADHYAAQCTRDKISNLPCFARAEFTPKEILDLLYFGYEPPPGMVEFVKKIKKSGKPIFILSNYFVSRDMDLRKMLEGKLDYCYGKGVFLSGNIFLSSEIRVAKPKLKAFATVLKNMKSILSSDNLNKDEVLFIDDQQINVIAANSFGYKGIVFGAGLFARPSIVSGGDSRGSAPSRTETARG